MKQPFKKNEKVVTIKKGKIKKNDKRLPPKSKKKVARKKNYSHPEYGTSKLEDRFAKEFLEKLGIKYIYQFKAESIGRYFDFFLPESKIFLEVDGDYW